MSIPWTNAKRTDGFGAQVQTIVWSYICAKMKGVEFVYTPFTEIEAGNFDNDPHFMEKLENFLGFKDKLPLVSKEMQPISPFHEIYSFIESNICAPEVKQYSTELYNIFSNGKMSPFVYNTDSDFHVAVHIRRPSKHDISPRGHTPDKMYLDVMERIRQDHPNKNLFFHIYSLNPTNSTAGIDVEKYKRQDTILHIDDSIQDTFQAFVFSDILVTSDSSFSYVAAFLNRGEIYYKSFWHPRMETWKEF